MEEKRVLLERERQKYSLVKKKHEDAKNSNLKAEELAKLAEDDLTQSKLLYSLVTITLYL
jgi:hypothetical protein